MPEDEITWALLAPAPRKWLEDRIEKYWDETFGDDDRFMKKWTVLGGTGAYSAVLDQNPGSEHTHEIALAEQLSRELPRPVYVLYLDENYTDTDAVDVYQDGRHTASEPAPYTYARKLGLMLPGDITEDYDLGVRGVVLVEGVSAADVARALGMSALPEGPVYIKDGPSGALMYNEEVGGAPPVMWRLSTAFPQVNVYTLSSGPEKGRFLVRVMRGGEETAMFDFPQPDKSGDAPVLESVKGYVNPRDIANALGVPLRLLNLD